MKMYLVYYYRGDDTIERRFPIMAESAQRAVNACRTENPNGTIKKVLEETKDWQ